MWDTGTGGLGSLKLQLVHASALLIFLYFKSFCTVCTWQVPTVLPSPHLSTGLLLGGDRRGIPQIKGWA